MAKRFKLLTRALGAEPPVPDVPTLGKWIAEHKGRLADITTWRLDAPLKEQVDAGITSPCAGGIFYSERILAALDGIEERKAVGEIHVDIHDVIEDAAGIVVTKKNAWCAVPAPHALGITDAYFHDTMEWTDAICGAYRTILRAMRDVGVTGHILISDTIDKDELASLAQPKVFFFHPEPDRQSLARILERQHQVAARKEDLPLLFSLTDEYDLTQLFLIDPDPASIAAALTHLDPDRIVAAGYCTKDDRNYWQTLVSAAGYSL